MASNYGKYFKYRLDITSPRPVRYDEDGKPVLFYKSDSVKLRFKITNGHCVKDLTGAIAKLRVDIPNGNSYYQKTNIDIIDPTDGDVELLLDKQAYPMQGSDINEDYITYSCQLELIYDNGYSFLTPHFLFNVGNEIGKPDDEIEGATPSVLGQAVLAKTILGKVKVDAETVIMIERASQPTEVKSNISIRLLKMI